MNNLVIGFVLGLFIGANFALLIYMLCVAAGRDDEEYQR